jgi:drug/metabolite transporter (DMT)-like permease
MAQLKRGKSFLAAMPATITIATMCISWVCMGEFIQGMQNGWGKPWFITYVIHSGYSLTLIPWAYLRWRRTGRLSCCSFRRCQLFAEDAALVVPMRQLLVLASFLQVLSSFSGFTWYLSLPATLVSANNAIYQSASAFVFVFSIFVLSEAVTLPKIVALLVCLAGVALVSFAPTSSADGVNQTVVGYLWVLASVLGYSAYEVFYARFSELRVVQWADVCRRIAHRQPHIQASATDASSPKSCSEENASADTESLLPATPEPAPIPNAVVLPVTQSPALKAEIAAFNLGAMGAITFLMQWPMFFVFDATGIETFEWPPAAKLRLLALNTVLDTLYNVALLFGIQITSPLWMSLGTILVVPASMVADKIIHNAAVSGQAAGGIVMIILGFAILQLPLPARWMRPIVCSHQVTE